MSSYPSYRSLVSALYQLQPFLTPPFQIMGILSEFHSRMEFDETGNVYLDRFASVVIGFVPDVDLERTVALAKELSDYVVDNPVFEGFHIVMAPRFISGMEWYPEEEEEDEDSEDSEDAEDSSLASSTASLSVSDSAGSWTADESSEPPPSDADADADADPSLSRVSSALS